MTAEVCFNRRLRSSEKSQRTALLAYSDEDYYIVVSCEGRTRVMKSSAVLPRATFPFYRRSLQEVEEEKRYYCEASWHDNGAGGRLGNVGLVTWRFHIPLGFEKMITTFAKRAPRFCFFYELRRCNFWCWNLSYFFS